MADLSSVTDADLIYMMHAGEQAALSELYQRYARHIYGLALKITGDMQAAEEATQDTLLKIWNAAGSWQPTVDAVHWLLRITRNTAIDQLRRARTRPTASDFDDEIGAVDATQADDFGLSLQDDQGKVREALRRLPDEQRAVIVLAFFDGLTHSSIAERLTLPLGTVKTRLRLGLQKLKILLADSEIEPG